MPEFVGREFDEQLLSEIPPDIDPCGENGGSAGRLLETERLAESLVSKDSVAPAGEPGCWGTLHAVRSVLSALALLLFVYLLMFGKS